MNEQVATAPSRPAAKATQVKGPFDVAPGGLRVLNSLFERHGFSVRVAVEGTERTSLSDFHSIEDLLNAQDLLALSLSRMEIRGRNKSGDASIAITLGGYSSGEISVHAPSLQDAEKLLSDAESSLRAMRSERMWPHNPLVKYGLMSVLYIASLLWIAQFIYRTLGALSQSNAFAAYFLAVVPVWYLSDAYKKAFPDPRFLIGKQLAPPKWAVFLVSAVLVPLLVTIFYDVVLKHWLGI